MPKMVCVKCQCAFRPEVNGTVVIEMASFGPYKIWEADTWKCPGCGVEVVSGFGHRHIKEHYEAGFNELLHKIETDPSIKVVYDCEAPQRIS